MAKTITTYVLYARHTGVDGNTYVQEHVVWDKDLFIAARQQEAVQANIKASNRGLARFEQITQEQYNKEKGK